MLYEFGLDKLFLVELGFFIDFFETEMGVGTADDDGFGNVISVFMRFGLRLFGDFNDGGSGNERGFFIAESLMGVRMLTEFVDAELIDSIVAAIPFGDGLAVLLEQVNLVKVGIHIIFIFYNLEANNLAVLNSRDCFYQSLDLFLR